MTLQYNISVGQAGPRPRVSHATLGSAVVVSIAVHAAAIAIAMLAFGKHAPAAEDPAAITVFVPPAPPSADPAAEEKPVEQAKPEPPPPPPEPQIALPPPEETTAIPDFKAPPPPPATSTPKPTPKPAPQKPAVAATPPPTSPAAQQQMVPPLNNALPPAAAPSIVPNWNVQLGAWMRSHQRYPSAARSRGEEGDVTVRFNFDAEGLVTAVIVEKSSGHAELDAAAVALFQGATLPRPGAAATRTVRVRYHLDD